MDFYTWREKRRRQWRGAVCTEDEGHSPRHHPDGSVCRAKSDATCPVLRLRRELDEIDCLDADESLHQCRAFLHATSLAEAKTAIAGMRDEEFRNQETGIEARLSASAVGKLVSNKATGKSMENGFSREEHNAMAANVGRLFETSRLVISRLDRDGDPNIVSIKRFASPVVFTDRQEGPKEAMAYITVKESRQHGSHIYTVEAIEIGALSRKVEEVGTTHLTP